MKLRFVRHWKRGIRNGDVREIADGAANTLLKRRLAVEVKEPEAKRNADPIPEPAPAGGKRRGRPREQREQVAMAEAGGEG